MRNLGPKRGTDAVQDLLVVESGHLILSLNIKFMRALPISDTIRF